MRNTTALQDRVARGAAFMDRRFPGWEKRIDLGRLNIGCSQSCILGQLYGDYGVGTNRLGINDQSIRQHELGFIAVAGGGLNQYPQLTEAWANEIVARLPVPAREIRKPKRSAARRMQPTRS